jgi:hypothetical protein
VNRFFEMSLGRTGLTLDLEVGHLRSVFFEAGDRVLRPLHTAPWVGDGPIDRASEVPPVEQALSGDFFCAPFSLNDDEGGPLHGWTANAPWRLRTQARSATGVSAEFVLSRAVLGAAVTKRLALREGHPFLYVAHNFDGGSGALPVSHHAMIRVADRANVSFSPKTLFFTPDVAPEPDPQRGRSVLRYPARWTDPRDTPLSAGGTTDLGTYPFATGHEDVVVAIEAPGTWLGWVAAVRTAERDIVLLLKNSIVLPSTMLWMSNGGRSYPPWSSRHDRVLGIEDGRTFGGSGHRASSLPNWLSQSGYPTALKLNPSKATPVRYCIGAIPLPNGWTRVRDVRPVLGSLDIADVSGASVAVPFDNAYLTGDAA